MRTHLLWRAAACGAVVLLAQGPSSGWASSRGCDTYSALASAVGLATLQSAPGLLLADGDVSMPGAQAGVDSLTGSSGWAGSPFSSTASGNLGLAGVNANDVPVFALSSYPTHPESSKSTPVSSLSAKSGTRSAEAEAAIGLPPAAPLTTGRVTSHAASACGDDGVLVASAASTAELVSVAGVLQIGSVASHAQVRVDATGRPALVGTMAVEGLTAMGQRVAVTDQGLVVAGSGVPFPGSPVEQAMADKGVTLRVIASSKNATNGTVVAPGLELTVRGTVPEAGTGDPMTSRFVLGQAAAFARMPAATAPAGAPTVSLPGSDVPARTTPAAGAAPGDTPAPAVDVAVAPGEPSGDTSAPAAPATAHPQAVRPAATAVAASIGPYPALACTAFLLLVAWLVFGQWGVRIQWR